LITAIKVGVDKQERISFHERFFARAMGLWADQRRCRHPCFSFGAGGRSSSLRAATSSMWIRLEGDVTELFDAQVIPGVRYATVTGMMTDDIRRIVTFEAGSKPRPETP